MFFRQRKHGSCLSYLFGCGGLGKAIAVDVVAGDEDWFIMEVEAAQATITHVIDTHVHADHLSGGRNLSEKVGAAYCLHSQAADWLRFPFTPLSDGDVIETGNVISRVLHTPGHTHDSISLLVSDRRRTEHPWFVMTGDTLFVGGIGRPDLAGQEQVMAGLLFDSLQTRLLVLPDTIEIWPGHQAGSVCGAGLSGKPSSTIGFEKAHQPGLKIGKREEFIRFLTEEIPPRPAEMDRIVRQNTSG